MNKISKSHIKGQVNQIPKIYLQQTEYQAIYGIVLTNKQTEIGFFTFNDKGSIHFKNKWTFQTFEFNLENGKISPYTPSFKLALRKFLKNCCSGKIQSQMDKKVRELASAHNTLEEMLKSNDKTKKNYLRKTLTEIQ